VVIGRRAQKWCLPREKLAHVLDYGLMTRWEYDVVEITDNQYRNREVLNRWGQEGWEAVSMAFQLGSWTGRGNLIETSRGGRGGSSGDWNGGFSGRLVVLLKRPIQAD
jgi:hypothetical protein